MEKLKTATGRSFDCDYFVPFEPANRITIRVHNIDIVTAATVFSNRRETVQLWYESEYAANYTKMIAIVPEGNVIRIVLGKE